MLYDKVRNQILGLRRQGFTPDQIRIRTTGAAGSRLLLELRDQQPGIIQTRGTTLNSVLGVEVDFMEGILETIYAWVPYVKVQFYVDHDDFPMVWIEGADQRLVNERSLVYENKFVEFVPEDITDLGLGRVHCRAGVKSVSPIAV